MIEVVAASCVLLIVMSVTVVPFAATGISTIAYDNNVLPPAALQLNGSDVTAVVISNVRMLNRSLTVDVGSLWHDPLVQNPQPSFLDVNLTGSVFSSLSLTSSVLLATNESIETDACDGMRALRPAPHWQLRSLRLFVLGTISALEYNITALLLCNASLTFTSLQQSSLRVTGSVLSNTVIRVGGDTLRVVLEAPLSLQRASAVAVDGARDLMWRLQSSAADAALRLSGGSVVSVRDCTFASAAPLYSGVTADGGVGIALEGASHVVVARNRCSGASMCSAALSLGAVTLRGGSLLALSSNAFSVATMARSAAALALYRAGVYVSWASLRVVEASTFAVDGNDVATDSRGVYVAGGTAATPVALDVASGGAVSIAANRVVFSRLQPNVDASLAVDATPIDFVFLCQSLCLRAADVASVVNVGSNNVSFAVLGENVSVVFLLLQRVQVVAAGGGPDGAVMCSSDAAIALGGGGVLSAEVALPRNGSSLTVQTISAVSVSGSIVVASNGSVVLAGNILTHSPQSTSSVPHAGAICAEVRVSKSVTLRDFGTFSVVGHRCDFRKQPNAALVRGAIVVEVSGAVLVASSSLFLVAENNVTMYGEIANATHGCIGVAVRLLSNVTLTSGGALSVLGNSVSSLVSAVAGVSVELSAAVISGGVLDVSFNDVNSIRCTLQIDEEVGCAGVRVVFTQCAASFSNRASVIVSGNTVSSTVTLTVPYVSGILFYGGLRATNSSSVRIASNSVNITTLIDDAAVVQQACGIDVSTNRGNALGGVGAALSSGSSLVVALNNVTVVQELSDSVFGIRVGLVMHHQLATLSSIAVGSTVAVVNNAVVIHSPAATVFGIVCRGGGAVVNSSKLLLSSNAVSLLGPTPPKSLARAAVAMEVDEPLVVSDGSFLSVDENHIALGAAGGTGIRVRCSSQASTNRAPGAMSVLRNAWVSIRGNVVTPASSQPAGSAVTCGIQIDASNSEGLALVLSSFSGIEVDKNVVVCASEFGVRMSWSSRFLQQIENFTLAQLPVSEWLNACSVVICESSKFWLSRNSVSSVGDAVHLLFNAAYNMQSIFSAGVPKGFLLASGSELQFHDNRIVSANGSGIVLNCSLNPIATDFITNTVASAYLVEHSKVVFVLNNVRSLLSPLRWSTSVASSSIGFPYACSYMVCNDTSGSGSISGSGGSAECWYVPSTCYAKQTFYAPTATMVQASSILVYDNILLATSEASAIVFDHSNGHSHTATFTDAALLLFHGNIMTSFGISQTAVVLFRCPAQHDEMRCIQGSESYTSNGTEVISDKNDHPTVFFAEGSNLSFTANGIWGSACGFRFATKTLSVSGETSSHLVLYRNTVTSTSMCFAFEGDLAIMNHSSWTLVANRCNSPRLMNLSTTVADAGSATKGVSDAGFTVAISFECDRVNSRVMQNAASYRRTVLVDAILATIVEFRTCSDISFTSRQTRTHTWSGSLPVTSSLSAYGTKSLHTLQPSRTLLLSTTLSFGIVSATNGKLSRSTSRSIMVSLSVFSSSPTYRNSVSIELASITSPVSASVTQFPSVSIRFAELLSRNANASTIPSDNQGLISFTPSVRCLSPTGLTAGLPQLFNDIFVSIDDASHRDLLREDITVSHVLQPSSSAVLDILQAIDGQQVDQDRNITTTAEVDGMHSEAVVLQIRNRTTLFRLLILRDLIAKGASSGQPVHVTIDIASLVLPRVLCVQYAVNVSLLRIRFVSQPKISAMQLALRTSIEATVSGSLLASLFSGDVSNDLPALALTALMGCAPPSTAVSGGFGSLTVLAPVLLYESYASVIFSNVVLLACIALLLVLAVLLCYASLRCRPQSALSQRLLQKLRLHQHRRATGEYWAKTSSFALTADEATKVSSRTLPSYVGRQASAMDTLLHPVAVYLKCAKLDSDAGLVPSAMTTAVVLCTASLYDVCLLVSVPSVLLSASLSLYPGTLFAAIRLMQLYQVAPQFNGAPSPFDVSAGGLAVGVVFTVILLPLPGLLYWVATRRIECSFHRFVVPLGESKQAYTVKYRMFTCCTWLEPYGRLLPSDASKLWGPLVGSSCRHWFWVVFSVLSGWVLCVGSLLQFYQEQMYCTAVLALLFAATGIFAAALLVLKPKRSTLLNVLSAASLGITGAVLAFSALTVYDRRLEMSDTVAVCLGVLQAVASLAKSAAGFFTALGMSLHGKRRAQMVLEWEIGPALSAEGRVAVSKYNSWQVRRGKAAALLPGHGTAMGFKEEMVGLKKLLRPSAQLDYPSAVGEEDLAISMRTYNLRPPADHFARTHIDYSRSLDEMHLDALSDSLFDVPPTRVDVDSATRMRNPHFDPSRPECEDVLEKSESVLFAIAALGEAHSDSPDSRDAARLQVVVNESGLSAPFEVASIESEFWGDSEELDRGQDEQDASVCEGALLRLRARQRRLSVFDGARGLLAPSLASKAKEDDLMSLWK